MRVATSKQVCFAPLEKSSIVKLREFGVPQIYETGCQTFERVSKPFASDTSAGPISLSVINFPIPAF